MHADDEMVILILLWDAKSFKSLEVINLVSHTSPDFPDLRVNPARIKQRCDAPVLFPQHFLYASAWFSSLWCSDKGGVGGECPNFSPFILHCSHLAGTFTQSALCRVKNRNQIWFLYHQLYKQPLMKSSRVTVTKQSKYVLLLEKHQIREWDKQC